MKITLVIMVRDEEKTIVDTLRSWLPIADNVVVVDTGSVDRTIPRVRNLLPGWEREGENRRWLTCAMAWFDFATNRNQALEVASEEFPGTWLVTVDADTRLHGFEMLRKFLTGYESDGYAWDSFQLRTLCGNLSYPMHRIFLAGSRWKFEGAVHEVPVHPDDYLQGEKVTTQPGPTIPGCWQVYQGTDGGSESKRDSWHRHLDILHRDGSQAGTNPRTLMYIAQTYACLGMNADAAQWYDLRWNRRDGYEPERWRAGLCLARLLASRPGVDASNLLLDLARLRPWRAEPWHDLALSYLDKDPHRALAYATMAASLDEPLNDEYMLEVDVYGYKAMLLVARCREALKDPDAALIAYAILRLDPSLPEAERVYVNQRIAILNGG